MIGDSFFFSSASNLLLYSRVLRAFWLSMDSDILAVLMLRSFRVSEVASGGAELPAGTGGKINFEWNCM